MSQNKRQRFQENDKTMDSLEEEKIHLNNFIHYTEKDWALLVAKMRRERLIALTALSRSKVMLAEMELFIAECELNNATEKTYKKFKLSPSADQDHQSSPAKQKRAKIPSLKTRRNAAKSTHTRSRSHTSTEELTPLKSLQYPSPNQATSSKTNSVSLNNNTGSTPVVPLSSLRQENSNSFNINRSLTESIIAEFDKPYLKIEPPEKSTTNVTSYQSITQCTMSNPYSKIERKKNIKISPVADAAAYKKAYTQDSLSYKSHILYAPPSSISQMPLKFAVTPMQQNSTPQKQAVQNRPIPKLNKCQNISNSTENLSRQMHVSVPTQVVHSENMHNIRHTYPVAHSLQTHVSFSTPVKSEQNSVSFSTPVTHNQDKLCTQLPLTQGQRHMSLPTTPQYTENRQEQKHVSQNTPDNRQMLVLPDGHVSNSPSQTVISKKHICVATPPLYVHSKTPYTFGQNNRTNAHLSQNCVPVQQ